MHVITDPAQCPIKPSDINTETHFWGAFGHYETEVAAKLVVRLCQEKGGWGPMAQEELDKFEPRGRFHWNHLIDGGFVVREYTDDTFRVTTEFVTKCYGASPAVPDLQVVEG